MGYPTLLLAHYLFPLLVPKVQKLNFVVSSCPQTLLDCLESVETGFKKSKLQGRPRNMYSTYLASTNVFFTDTETAPPNNCCVFIKEDTFRREILFL